MNDRWLAAATTIGLSWEGTHLSTLQALKKVGWHLTLVRGGFLKVTHHLHYFILSRRSNQFTAIASANKAQSVLPVAVAVLPHALQELHSVSHVTGTNPEAVPINPVTNCEGASSCQIRPLWLDCWLRNSCKPSVVYPSGEPVHIHQ